MKRLVVMIAPFNTRSGYGDHARSIYYSIMDREDLDIKCIDVKWGNTPRNHLRPEVPRHKKLLDTFVRQEEIQGQPDPLQRNRRLLISAAGMAEGRGFPALPERTRGPCHSPEF